MIQTTSHSIADKLPDFKSLSSSLHLFFTWKIDVIFALCFPEKARDDLMLFELFKVKDYICVCIYIHIYIHTYTCTYTYIYREIICICIYMHVYV